MRKKEKKEEKARSVPAQQVKPVAKPTVPQAPAGGEEQQEDAAA